MATMSTGIVFVVDDDISVRESLELLIGTAGWRPETFALAQDFLSRPRPNVACCLVLDVRLPGLDGLELQRQLVDRADMPIIFITGHGNVPMTVQINTMIASDTGEHFYNIEMSAVLLTTLVPLLIYFISGRWFIRGIAAGALKG